MEEIEICNGRIVKKGDKVLFYTEHKSYSWNNGFYIIESIDSGQKRINAYPEDGDQEDISSIHPETVY